MGGPYPQLFCHGCDREFRDGEEVNQLSSGIYNASEEKLDCESYSNKFYCWKCWGKFTEFLG